MSRIWTVKVPKELDELVSKMIKLLGYTSKAEFVREAVRDSILRKEIWILGLQAMDELSNEKGDALSALERMLSKKVPKKLVEEELAAARDEVEELIRRVSTS
ncbi:MAG: hypothetical protein DRO00_09675 [Thermoproteota archaeon]|nr:MAG: hypothetical protein DRO00_09675 [Candidatus Korarchaeota archaeon]